MNSSSKNFLWTILITAYKTYIFIFSAQKILFVCKPLNFKIKTFKMPLCLFCTWFLIKCHDYTTIESGTGVECLINYF